MFLLWSSDASPCLTHAPASRWPICVIPASLYAEAGGVNLTLQAASKVITTSFNKLAVDGIKLHDMASRGAALAP